MKTISEMSTAEMLAEYNELTGKNTKRFSTRKDGERLLEKARAAAENGDKPVPTVEQLLEKKPALRTQKPKKETLDRSTAIRESWNNKVVAEARSQRHAVKVDGEEYASVSKAFKALKLPSPKHIRFRGELVKNGTATFVHGDREFKFKLMPASTTKKED